MRFATSIHKARRAERLANAALFTIAALAVVAIAGAWLAVMGAGA